MRRMIRPSLETLPFKPIVGSMNVRRYAELTVAGKQYWKISDRTMRKMCLGLPSRNTRPAPLSRTFWRRHRHQRTTWFRLATERRAVCVGPAQSRRWRRNPATHKKTAVAIFETANDAAGKPAAYRINESEWVDASALRIFTQAPLPRGLGANERWIDIDLDTQILVGFEGTQAVYATLVSSGGRETPTEPGVYRMWKKISETDMNGLNGEDPYSVATVPWTQFFSSEQGLAIHTAYWHNDFDGAQPRLRRAPRCTMAVFLERSHKLRPAGRCRPVCLNNRAPLFAFAQPSCRTDPERGYAIKVLEARTMATASGR